MVLKKGIFVQLTIKIPPKKGSFGQYTQQNGRNSQNSPVLLCLGSNWELCNAVKYCNCVYSQLSPRQIKAITAAVNKMIENGISV